MNQSVIDAMALQINRTPMPLRQRRGLQPRLAAPAAATIAAAVALVVLVLGSTGTPPAYAVARQGNGQIKITLREITGVTGLNAKLASMGVRVRAVPVIRGCVAPVHVVGVNHRPLTKTKTLTASSLIAHPLAVRGSTPPKPLSLASLTVRPPTDPNRTLVLAATRSGFESAAQTVVGSLPACVRRG